MDNSLCHIMFISSYKYPSGYFSIWPIRVILVLHWRQLLIFSWHILSIVTLSKVFRKKELHRYRETKNWYWLEYCDQWRRKLYTIINNSIVSHLIFFSFLYIVYFIFSSCRCYIKSPVIISNDIPLRTCMKWCKYPFFFLSLSLHFFIFLCVEQPRLPVGNVI